MDIQARLTIRSAVAPGVRHRRADQLRLAVRARPRGQIHGKLGSTLSSMAYAFFTPPASAVSHAGQRKLGRLLECLRPHPPIAGRQPCLPRQER
jgi:hypothetical protein